MLEQQLDVAGDALREFGRRLERGVERRHLQRADAADHGRHGLGRAAQHVHIGVVNRLVPLRRRGVDHHFPGAVLLGVVCLDDVGPEHAGRAELGDLHEVVGGHREREAQFAGGLVHRQPGVRQAGDVVVAGREGECQLLDDGRSGVGEDVGRNGHDADVLVGGRLPDECGDACEALLAVGRAEVALGRKTLYQRVDREGHVGFGGRALLFELGDHQFGDVAHALAAERQRNGGDADAVEQLVQIGGGEALLHDLEAQRIDTRIEEFERLGVGRLRALDRHGLVHMPAVVGARTANVGELACLRAQELDTLEVLGAVVGADVESLSRTPHQFPLVIGSFQIYCDHLFPFLGRDRRKFGEQLFTFGICHNYLEISNKCSRIRFQIACKGTK